MDNNSKLLHLYNYTVLDCTYCDNASNHCRLCCMEILDPADDNKLPPRWGNSFFLSTFGYIHTSCQAKKTNNQLTWFLFWAILSFWSHGFLFLRWMDYFWISFLVMQRDQVGLLTSTRTMEIGHMPDASLLYLKFLKSQTWRCVSFIVIVLHFSLYYDDFTHLPFFPSIFWCFGLLRVIFVQLPPSTALHLIHILTLVHWQEKYLGNNLPGGILVFIS